jgi:basic membrane protein A and related proteins
MQKVGRSSTVRRVLKFAAVALAGSLALSACGGDDDGGTASGDSTEAASDIQVGLAYDIGGRGDKSFNDSAATGLDRASDELGVEAEELEAATGETDAQKEERLRLLADGGYNPIIAVGFAYETAVEAVVGDYPDVNFGIIDSTAVKADNLANLVFAENEGSFLVGAAAALKSQTGTVGFVGGVNVPLIQTFEAGFVAGAKAANPSIVVQSQYLTQPPDFTGFTDPAKGRTAGQGLYDAGADVVFHAAGGSGTGVFEAALAANGLAIGVDSDQYQSAPPNLQPVIMTSMIKRVDVAVFEFISSVVDGDPLTGEQRFDLERDGVGYATSNTGPNGIADIEAQLEDYKQQIIDGSITVPTS